MKWFKHDSRANRDAKIEKLMNKFGAEGYALYWLCLELIAERIDVDCADFELEHDAETLGFRLKIDTMRVEEIMRWMVANSLFENENGRITCLKLALRIEESTVRNPQIRLIKQQLNSTKMSDFVPDNLGQSGTSGARLDKIRLDKKEEYIMSGNPIPDGVKTPKNSYQIQDVLSYLNEKAQKRFTMTVAHKRFIEGRFKEGASLDDFKRVIDIKVKAWASDSKMAPFLRPETLFNATKFWGYVNELPTQTDEDAIEKFKRSRGM